MKEKDMNVYQLHSKYKGIKLNIPSEYVKLVYNFVWSFEDVCEMENLQKNSSSLVWYIEYILTNFQYPKEGLIDYIREMISNDKIQPVKKRKINNNKE